MCVCAYVPILRAVTASVGACVYPVPCYPSDFGFRGRSPASLQSVACLAAGPVGEASDNQPVFELARWSAPGSPTVRTGGCLVLLDRAVEIPVWAHAYVFIKSG